jgi:exodeoxyribonuclease V beta subunit
MTERHFIPLAGPFDVEMAGTRLIEAGAGTGKTWTIAALMLRLLLEKAFAIGEILVVTYTRAATGELRARIRARLAEALAAFEAGHADEPYLRDLLVRHAAARETAMARLRLAIESFDECSIHTIHGFCQRALAETAFEAGCGFERELLADQQELLDAVARDAWRKLMAKASLPWARWLLGRFGGPAGPGGLAAAVRAHLGRVDTALAVPEPVDRFAAEREFAAAFDVARAHWNAQSATILARIAGAKLNQQSYKPEKMAPRSAALAAWFAQPTASLPPPQDADHFGLEKILAKLNKGAAAPEHPFFAAMDDLLAAAARLEAAFDAATRRLVHDFLLDAREALTERKRRSGQQTYDDLLIELARALQGPGGDSLADGLRSRYRAALVDEFQDTDPLQLGIFTRVFGAAEQPLIFVGDPKQAIYGFRGADVFAYLAARRQADAGYALLENRRSDASLLNVFNALFDRARPFLLDALPFDAAVPARMQRRELRIDDGAAPFTLWTFQKPAEAKSLSKEIAQPRVSEAVAADIVRLLGLAAQGRATRDGRPLAGGDIAVLVRTRRQGEMVRQALARRGIASVALGGGSVWHSEEAEEVERLLLALAAPSREGLVRAALATVLLGADAAALAAWADDGSARLERFHDDHLLCRERGFMAMWRRLLRREQVVARMLARPDGERRLTNYRHLAELLQEAEHAGALDLAGLARHVARQRNCPDGPEAEESQLRLESDAQLVRIVTIHAAKGLQYPVVYCPFLWEGKKRDAADWPVHAHDADSGQACLDFGSPRIDALRRQAELEDAAEELRLAYVALTRAEHRCIVVWAKANMSERSPLAWLLFGPREDGAGDPRAELADRLAQADEAALQAELDALAARLGASLRVAPLPADGTVAPSAPEAHPALEARRFAAAIPASWRISSFSSLAARLAEAEAPDHDAVAAPPAEPGAVSPAPTFSGIHAFPRGTRAGSCLHALLERIDFQSLATTGQSAAAALEEFGYAPEWRPALERMVADVVNAPLDGSGLTLADVTRAERLVELEFTFPLGSAAARQGYMKGFIDLVFRRGGRWYIVDWKSNWLGEGPDDYAPPRLAEEMRRHRYDLQLRIYAAALKRALTLREPGLDWEAGFGGVFYLFLRGMAPGSANGIHFARPTLDEIAEFLP